MREFEEEELMEFLDENRCDECWADLDGIHCTTVSNDKVCINCCTCDDKEDGDFIIQTIILDKDGDTVCLSARSNHTWGDL